jgi:adenosine deaminase
MGLSASSPAYYRLLPKVDLHRHLEGSLRLRTLLEVGRAHGLNMPNTSRLRELVQIGDDEAFTFENFLSKFRNLRLFYRSPEIIDRVTREAVEDAAQDNVRYLELRFTPVALSAAEHFPLSEVMDWVCAAAARAQESTGSVVRLIASLNRHEGPAMAEEVARLAADRIGQGIVGLDLAGDETATSGLAFVGVFQEARQAGLHITIHAGEWAGARNVIDAMSHLRAERIGHGVRVLEDPVAAAMARERAIPFEVCLTSNYQSGVIPDQTVHPLPRMLQQGLNVTLNTDDPSISQITLGDEFFRAYELGVSSEILNRMATNAIRAAFLQESEKRRLEDSLIAETTRFLAS